MADPREELDALRSQMAELTRRIYALELKAGLVEPRPTVVAKVETPPGIGSPLPPPSSAPLPITPVEPRPTTPSPTLIKDVRDGDLESMVGGQWLNRIGIAALLIGAAYFLKLAFDNGWIGPSGRVAIGLLAGIGLVIWAERIHSRGHKYFAYSLTSVGVGIMYLSLWAAFQLYHLVPGGVAFAAMIAVTASTAVIAVRKDAQILAAVAMSGGFATPTLLSTGQNRPVELFSYLLMLDVFAIVLASFRPWRSLLAGAYLGTIVYYFGWAAKFYSPDQRATATIVITSTFVLFASLPLLRKLQGNHDGDETSPPSRSKTVIAIAIFNPLVYFSVLYSLFEADYQSELAWVAIFLAAIYIAISRQLNHDLAAFPPELRVEKWLHLALGLGFLTLAIPIKLDGHRITIGWLVEAGLLLGVGHRARNDFLKYASIVALGLGLFRLIFFENFVTTQLFVNWRFLTYLVAIAVFAGMAWVVREERGARDTAFTIVLVCINVLALLALNYEVSDHFARQMQEAKTYFPAERNSSDWRETQRIRDFTYSALWMIFGAVNLAIGFMRKLPSLRWQGLALIGVTIVKVFLYDLGNLSGAWRVLSFIALGVLLMAISFLYQKGYLTAGDDK